MDEPTFWLDRLWQKHWPIILFLAWTVMVLLAGVALGKLWGLAACG